VKDKDVLKLLLKDGWVIDRISGSHHILKKNEQHISLPIHNREVPKGLLNAILKQAGLK